MLGNVTYTHYFEKLLQTCHPGGRSKWHIGGWEDKRMNEKPDSTFYDATLDKNEIPDWNEDHPPPSCLFWCKK